MLSQSSDQNNELILAVFSHCNIDQGHIGTLMNEYLSSMMASKGDLETVSLIVADLFQKLTRFYTQICPQFHSAARSALSKILQFMVIKIINEINLSNKNELVTSIIKVDEFFYLNTSEENKQIDFVISTDDDQTVLHMLASVGYNDAVGIMLTKLSVMTKNGRAFESFIDHEDLHGNTALQCAKDAKNLKLVNKIYNITDKRPTVINYNISTLSPTRSPMLFQDESKVSPGMRDDSSLEFLVSSIPSTSPRVSASSMAKILNNLVDVSPGAEASENKFDLSDLLLPPAHSTTSDSSEQSARYLSEIEKLIPRKLNLAVFNFPSSVKDKEVELNEPSLPQAEQPISQPVPFVLDYIPTYKLTLWPRIVPFHFNPPKPISPSTASESTDTALVKSEKTEESVRIEAESHENNTRKRKSRKQ